MSDIRVVPEMLWLKNNFDIKKSEAKASLFIILQSVRA